MIVNVYSIRDDVSEVFGEPVTAANDEIARRMFKNTLNVMDFKNMYARKNELALYKIARFDTVKGYLEGEAPTIIARGEIENADSVRENEM